MKVSLRLNRNINSQFAFVLEETEKALNESFQKTVGRGTSFEQWEKLSESASAGLDQLLLTDFHDLPGRYQKLFGRLLTRAWKSKYNNIISRYKTADPSYTLKYNTSGGYTWHWRKRIGKGRYRPTHRPSATIKYTTWALATGFLRESMGRAFGNGGRNKSWLTIGNPLLQVVAEIDEGKMRAEDTRYYFFLQHLMDAGVIDDVDDFVSLLPGDVDEIRRKMINIFVRDFARDFQRRQNG